MARRRETRRDFGCRLLDVRNEMELGVGEWTVRVGSMVRDGGRVGDVVL